MIQFPKWPFIRINSLTAFYFSAGIFFIHSAYTSKVFTKCKNKFYNPV